MGKSHISVVIAVLGVPSCSNRSIRSSTGVDGVYTSERINIGDQICQSFVRTRLKRRGVATGCGIERVNGRQDGVRIFAGSSTTCISRNIASRGIPE